MSAFSLKRRSSRPEGKEAAATVSAALSMNSLRCHMNKKKTNTRMCTTVKAAGKAAEAKKASQQAKK